MAQSRDSILNQIAQKLDSSGGNAQRRVFYSRDDILQDIYEGVEKLMMTGGSTSTDLTAVWNNISTIESNMGDESSADFVQTFESALK